MNEQIKTELNKLLDQWQAGVPVRSLVLGHRTRPRTNEHGETVHDKLEFRQAIVMECVFRLVQVWVCRRDDFSFPEFQELAHSTARDLKLSAEEYEAAASFAWVVFHRGWSRALEGHHERDYMTVTKKADA